MKNSIIPLVSSIISMGLTMSSSYRVGTPSLLSAPVYQSTFGSGPYGTGAGANPPKAYAPDVNVGTIDGFKLEGMLMALLGQSVNSQVVPDGSTVYRIMHPDDYQTYLEVRFTTGSRTIPNAQWNITGRAPYFSAKLNLKGVSMPIQSQRRLEQVILSVLNYTKQSTNTTQALNELVQYDLGLQMNQGYQLFTRQTSSVLESDMQQGPGSSTTSPVFITVGGQGLPIRYKEASMSTAIDNGMSADKVIINTQIDNLRTRDQGSSDIYKTSARF